MRLKKVMLVTGRDLGDGLNRSHYVTAEGGATVGSAGMAESIEMLPSGAVVVVAMGSRGERVAKVIGASLWVHADAAEVPSATFANVGETPPVVAEAGTRRADGGKVRIGGREVG